MKIALAAVAFINHNVTFNLSQIEKFALLAHKEGADLVVFGEAFLQGFDALCWDYENDKNIAISLDDAAIQKIQNISMLYSIDILFGFLEKSEEYIFSSCALIASGSILTNYRRISTGWKEVSKSDHHYKEGNKSCSFLYRNKSCKIALCGDGWDYPELFKGADLLFWPVYVNFSSIEWDQYMLEYADQAHLMCPKTVMVNSISKDPLSLGGAFYFQDGKILEKLPLLEENLLIIDIE